jgi:hypothetical protein
MLLLGDLIIGLLSGGGGSNSTNSTNN